MVDPIAVRLTWGEISRCGLVALSRATSNLKIGRKDAYGAEKDGGLGFDKHWIGCMGENAVAKHFNVYWRATEFGVVDVGGLLEVRSTDADYKRLWAHDDDKDERPFTLSQRFDQPRNDDGPYVGSR